MESGKWQKVKELYEAALQCPEAQRVRFLDENCDGDTELRREVESLLSFSDDAGSFLETAAVGEVAEDILDETAKSGQRFGHYEIIRQIGAGGMGEVYLAHDTQLGRRVALKLLPTDYTTDENRARRFKQEARAASALNHPNIIVIHEIGETPDNTLFIATEYIEGETLRERLSREDLNPAETLDFAVQLAGALTAAHEAGIIHRDIKPENIILRPDGYLKVLDFGLAKLLENQFRMNPESSTLINQNTAPGMIMGTVRYMSPEQARGQETDERTDIFSFGIVLYEMITGQAPFDGESNSDVMVAILDKEPPPLARFSSDTPAALQQIVSRTLEKAKNERYQSMRELLIDLKDVRDELQIQAKLDKSAENKTSVLVEAEPAENNKAQTGGAAAIAAGKNSFIASNKNSKLPMIAALVAVFAGFSVAGIWFFGIRSNAPVNISVNKITQLTTFSGLDDFPSMSPDGNAVAYCSDHNGTFEIYVKPLTFGAKEIQVTSDGGQNLQPAWSPDGKHIVYFSKQRGGIWVIPATGGDARQLTDFGSHPAWSPDGTQIVFQSIPLTDLGAVARNALPPSTLWLVAANGGEARQLTQIGNPAGGHGSPAWSPDGKRIAFEANLFTTSSVWTVSLGGTDPQPVSSKNAPNSRAFVPGSYAPTFAPDGKSVLYFSGVVLQAPINPETGEVSGEPAEVAGIVQTPLAIRRVSFSADGKRMAYNVLRRTESIASVQLRANSNEADGAPIAVVNTSTVRLNFPSFSPDGSRIAYSSCSIGGAGCDIWLVNKDGGSPTQLTTAESNELQPGWFPDGAQIAYVSNRTGHRTLWAINLNTKREQMLLDLKNDIEYMRLSPDAKQVAFNSTKDGVINVWTALLDGGEPKQLTFDKELMGFAAWSPDGKWLAFQMKRGDDNHIMVMPGDGGASEQLTFDKGQSWAYGWSPDNDKILFAGFRNGIWNVFSVSRTTKKLQPLTDYKKLNSFVRYPSWSPLGNQIVYEYSETTGNIWVADLK